ncbi:hypothetical protein JTE90_002016 [Oedothorax gibbosus]|uniref:Uncharacterized protein n=1 Tax=Oedothorax gibbosus TaxID=931172 RepID=A0AAV6UMX6_9ARAC|nr:hypothetical protein JTE90_002016 [Oedothorax gibbosus]
MMSVRAIFALVLVALVGLVCLQETAAFHLGHHGGQGSIAELLAAGLILINYDDDVNDNVSTICLTELIQKVVHTHLHQSRFKVWTCPRLQFDYDGCSELLAIR